MSFFPLTSSLVTFCRLSSKHLYVGCTLQAIPECSDVFSVRGEFRPSSRQRSPGLPRSGGSGVRGWWWAVRRQPGRGYTGHFRSEVWQLLLVSVHPPEIRRGVVVDAWNGSCILYEDKRWGDYGNYSGWGSPYESRDTTSKVECKCIIILPCWPNQSPKSHLVFTFCRALSVKTSHQELYRGILALFNVYV